MNIQEATKNLRCIKANLESAAKLLSRSVYNSGKGSYINYVTQLFILFDPFSMQIQCNQGKPMHASHTNTPRLARPLVTGQFPPSSGLGLRFMQTTLTSVRLSKFTIYLTNECLLLKYLFTNISFNGQQGSYINYVTQFLTPGFSQENWEPMFNKVLHSIITH